MTLQLLKPLKANGQILTPGTKIRVAVETGKELLKQGIARKFDDQSNVIWRNPHPKGTPAARKASWQEIINAMLYGLTLDEEQREKVEYITEKIIQGKAKLQDLREILGGLQ